ncbi:related to tRNA isopentenylpyrophosphate transferase [Sporisorium reilianum SRZ2]|uniref:Related to tRNA isopentenylpyrophosphate transferase n=1 Tax=Sporisorium reilianum (strain SRZ2) TaxID=999809 RepID=E6ZJT0_SPORE|nr:related to tRNA isopentenylpyrophosphate transferase [Sporisorium reilianum SRZ2]
MQIYKGLDIITNKATPEEMQGVAHHLLGFLDPAHERDGGAYDVTRFVADTNRIVRGLGRGGKVPIACGGTTYYVQHLLFPRLVSSGREDGDGGDGVDLSADVVVRGLGAEERALLEQVSVRNGAKLDLAAKASADPRLAMALWQLLDKLDPTMAARWHYRDSRKVANSLRVYRETGRAHSAWIAQQDTQTPLPPSPSAEGVSSGRKLLLWLWCDPPVLRQRLDARVDDMAARGLEAEVREMRAIARSMLHDVTYESGIFQTIGYRQFAEYLHRLETLPLTPLEQQKEFGKAVEDTKTATRQYAKSQLKWVQNKLVPEVRRAQAALAASGQTEIYLLDATDVAQWDDKVLGPALEVVQRFLNHEELPDPRTISNPTAAALYLYAGRTPNQALSKLPPAHDEREGTRTIHANTLYTCATCTFDEHNPVRVRAVDKAAHERGRHHRNNVKRKMSVQDKEARIREKIERGQAAKLQRERERLRLKGEAKVDEM